MSVVCTNTGYLSVADDCGTTGRNYMVHAWVWAGSLVASSVVSSGSDTVSDEDYRALHLANTGAVQARENDASTTATATSTVVSGEVYLVGEWVPGSAIFVSSTQRYAIGNAAAVRSNTSSNAPATPFTYTRIGGRAANNGGNSAIRIAGVSIWDVTGFSTTDMLSLAERLGDSESETIDDPRFISAEAGQVWSGKATHFWRLRDVADIDDLIGSADMVETVSGGFPQTGTDGTNPINPPYAPYGVPTVTAVSEDPLIEGDTGATITGTLHEFGGVDPTSLVIGTAAQTIGSATATETTFTVSIGNDLYGLPYPIILTSDSGESNEVELEVARIPAATQAYANITETPATSGLRVTSTADIAIGSQVHYRNFLNASAASQAIADVTVQADGSVTINDDTITRPATLEVRVNNNDGEGWSAFETITLDDPADVSNPELIGTDEIDAAYFLRDTFSITLAEQLGGGTWPWTLEAGGPLPGDWALNAGTGEITGTAATVGSYGPFTIRATGDTTDVDFTVTITVSLVPNISAGGRQSRFFARVGQLMSR